MKPYSLFLDDIRFPAYPSSDPNDLSHWEICRTMQAAVDLVLARGLPQHIAFDHDLGWDTLQPIEGSFLIAPPGEGKEMPSGFDFAKWLVESDLNGTINLPEDFSWSIHSSNPVGAENIQGLLKSYLKSKYGK
jgi:hypothetical protein